LPPHIRRSIKLFDRIELFDLGTTREAAIVRLAQRRE